MGEAGQGTQVRPLRPVVSRRGVWSVAGVTQALGGEAWGWWKRQDEVWREGGLEHMFGAIP